MTVSNTRHRAAGRTGTEASKTRWQGHSLQALVEHIAKTQALETRWQNHPLQALVE